MKYFSLMLISFAAFLFSCTDNKTTEKKLMDDVMTVHNRVMEKEDKLMENKMIIDSLLKQDHFDAKDPAQKAGLKLQNEQLTKADEAMDNWMHNFDPNNKKVIGDGKVKYLQDQNKLILQVDSMITAAVKSSTALLAQQKHK